MRCDERRVVAGKTRVYTGSDGVMVPVITQAEKLKRRANVKEKRRKCGQKASLAAAAQGGGPRLERIQAGLLLRRAMKHQHVAVTHQNHAATGRLMRREADRLGFRQASERIANVDGAPWIREQLQYHLAEFDGLGLDFYHLGENVHRAKRTVFGETSPEGKAWVEDLMHAFKHEATTVRGSGWCNGERTSDAHPRNAKRPIGC